MLYNVMTVIVSISKHVQLAYLLYMVRTQYILIKFGKQINCLGLQNYMMKAFTTELMCTR